MPTRAVKIWVWKTGETPHGEPIIDRCLFDEVPPEGAWEAEQDADAWRADILNELEVIDKKSIRALREKDSVRIAALEARAVKLRARLGII